MTTKAEGEGIDLASLKALFQETLEEQMAPLRQTVSDLQAKVEATDKMIPKFVPMANRKNPSGMPTTPAEHLAAMTGMRPGDTRGGTARQVTTTVNGKPMDQGVLKALLDSYAPAFAAGDLVRINPEAQRRNWPEGKTWGPILAKGRTNPDGIGVIREVDSKLTPYGWLFRVKVDEHTPERGMNFEAHELLHA